MARSHRNSLVCGVALLKLAGFKLTSFSPRRPNWLLLGAVGHLLMAMPQGHKCIMFVWCGCVNYSNLIESFKPPRSRKYSNKML